MIDRIRTEFALYAAPLDAMLAEIACEEAAFKTKLSPRHPTSYVDAVLSNMGGGTQLSLPLAVSPPALVPAALPSPDVNSQCQTDCPRARPRRRTGRRNIPRAPSSYVMVAPTHPELLQGGRPTPTSTMLAQATSPCRSVVSSPTPASTTPHTSSLHPFTFNDGTLLSLGGGNAPPFRECGPTPPQQKRTRRKLCPGQVCHHHGPRAPNLLLGDLFLDEVCFFGSSVFSSTWWIVIWCIALLLHRSASVLLFWSLHPSFSVSWLRHKSCGGVSM